MPLRSRAVRRAFALSIAALAIHTAAGGDESPITQWIRQTATPFETCEPHEDHRDLAALRQIVGDAHIVALGEGTHGTREFFQLKHRITEYLATEMGFTTFAIEANLPEAQRVNEYVLTGRGDAREAIRGMYFWTWNTEEVLALVEWMRKYNASGRGRMEFVGFDMQTPDTAAAIVRRFVQRLEPMLVDSVSAIMTKISLASGPVAGFVTATGTFPVVAAAGRHVRFSGLIRTESVTGFAGLWWRADVGRASRAFDNMQKQEVNATRDWKRYDIALDIPADATNINFGMLMSGKGRAWFDSLEIDIDGKRWQDGATFDLSLERADGPIGFGNYAAPGYSIAMDDKVASVGKRSLRLASVDGAKAPGAPGSAGEAIAAAERLTQRLEAGRGRYARATTPAETDWALRNAQVLLQRARLADSNRGYMVRDSAMAANIEWIVDRAPKGSKIVLWAHNGHVQRREGFMGSWLAKRYGKDMVVIGQTTNEGYYTAIKTGLGTHELKRGPPGSFEAFAHDAGIPRFLLELRRARENAAVATLLRTGVSMRSIGGMAMDVQFSPTPILDDYDVLTYIDKTEATRPIVK